MKRKIISVLTAIMIIAASICPSLTALAVGTVPSVEGGVYQISNADELLWFANAVNSGSQSIKGKLTADIQLPDDVMWTPIGSYNVPFKGTFDGDGHTVSGVRVDTTDTCAGFFGRVVIDREATEDIPEVMNSEFVMQHSVTSIKNLKITNSTVKGGYYVGGIVGYAENLGISDCSFSGDVIATENSIGGVVGWAYYYTVVNQCSAEGTVSGNQRVGGLVGFANGNSVVVKSYCHSDVTGKKNVGVVVGTLSASFLEGCFAFGSVTANSSVGGLVGYSLFSTVCDSYVVAKVNGTGANVGSVVGLIDDSDWESTFYSHETSEVEDSEGIGRTLDDMKLSSFVKELNGVKAYFCFDYTGINDGYPVLAWMLSLNVWAGDRSVPQQNASGTYIISKPSELAWFASLVNGTLSGVEANPTANATVVDDLLMNINVDDETASIIEWTPIGTEEHPFNGVFNGGGYSIAGIYTTESAGTNGVNVGLFGYIGSGSVTNTVVLDGKISGIENVGGIAGYVGSGSIVNSCSDAQISGDKAVGGVVGNLGSANASVSTSAMLGRIVGTNYSDDKAYLTNVGGVVGFSNRATVDRCFSCADIDAPLARFVGGLVGYNSMGSVTNSYNTADMISGNVTVGGLVGYNNNGTVKNCYVSTKVTGSSPVGVAFGQTNGSNVSNCIYDGKYKENLLLTGATEMTQSEMTGSKSVTNMGFSATDWRATPDDTYFYYFPQLMSMYNLSSVSAIKEGSVKSVKRVQDKYVAKVQLDGRTDTYFETLEEAISYASSAESSKLPTIYLISDVEINSTIDITANIGIYSENRSTLKRGSGFTGTLFNVTSQLTIGSKLYGDDDDLNLYIDGGDIESESSAFTVAEDATLMIYSGVKIYGFKTVSQEKATVMGAVIKNNGTVEIGGGIFDQNIGTSVGGVVYNENGTLNVTGGTFTANEATQGAVFYNNDGQVTVKGGTFKQNVAKLKGGVIASYGVYATTLIGGNTSMTLNQSTYGGALAAMNYSVIEITGGTLDENRAYSTGGAIQIETGAEVRITGATFSGNTSDKDLGNAVYNDSTLSIGRNAQLDSSNDIYLPNGKTLDISSKLLCSGYAATITPQSFKEKNQVLGGDAMSTNYMKVGISNSKWYTLANGTMTCLETTTVATVSKKGAYSVEYTTLASAFDSVAEDETAIITLVADAPITSTITVKGDVTLLCDDATYTAIRTGSFYGIMFDVAKGSVLRLGDAVADNVQQSQVDYAAETDSQGLMIIDGGKELTGVVGAAAINVQSGAALYMHECAVVQNCKNTTTGAITVSGEMHMYGGTVRNNDCCYGAIYIKNGASLSTYGGVIANNVSSNPGESVHSLGTVTRNVQTYNYYYIEKLYDDDGNIIGSADPVKVGSSKTDILVKNGEAVYLSNNLIYVGAAESDIYVTATDTVPESTEFTRYTMTLDLAKYTVGNIVVSGDDVISNYTYFNTCTDGYTILYTGALGINKLVAKSTSNLKINRDTLTVSGFNMGTTVSKLYNLFENDKIYMRVYDANGKMLKNSATIATDCTVKLLDTSNKTIDTLSIVIRGDVNGDGKTDGTDSVIIKAMAGGMLNSSNTTAAKLEAADINFDGVITSVDAEHLDLAGLGLQEISQVSA